MIFSNLIILIGLVALATWLMRGEDRDNYRKRR